MSPVVCLPRCQSAQRRSILVVGNESPARGSRAWSCWREWMDRMPGVPIRVHQDIVTGARSIANNADLLRGKEMVEHTRLAQRLAIQIFLPIRMRPWQRGTNEYTNALLRQYLPKGTDLSCYTLR